MKLLCTCHECNAIYLIDWHFLLLFKNERDALESTYTFEAENFEFCFILGLFHTYDWATEKHRQPRSNYIPLPIGLH